ncbi:hypothetical protein [Bradyrhizobium ottawaense]|uniref:hypothetical protein n=1 Tax=Bradyrhizobium ottawaense TaxID=931866 RepID=UPI0015CF592C|nr:hypothetical protein [Bradyrhizobium ottawaense]
MRASNPFFAAMNAIANPQVGVDINGDVGVMNDDRRAAAMASSIVATYRGTAPG